MKNNGVITTERIINILRQGESTEFLTYFPEYTVPVRCVEANIKSLKKRLLDRVQELDAQVFETQKDYALAVKDDKFAAFFFEHRKKGTTVDEWFSRMESWKLTEYMDRVIPTVLITSKQADCD